MNSLKLELKQLGLYGQAAILFLIFCTSLSVWLENPLPIVIYIATIVAYIISMRIDVGFYLLIGLLPISLNVEINSALTTDIPDEPLMWLLFIYTLLYIFSHSKLIPDGFLKNKVVFIIALSFAWMLITLVMSQDFLPSLKFVLAKSWYLICFLILPVLVIKKMVHFKIIIISFLIGFIGVVFYNLIKHASLGFDFEKVNQAIMPIYHNHVNYSAVISLIIPILVFIFWYQPKQSILKWLTLCLIVIFLIALYFTYGRAAWAALFVATTMYFIVRLKIIKPAIITGYLALASLVFWLAKDQKYFQFKPVYEQTIMHDNFLDHLIATLKGKDVSSMERVYRWIAAMRMSSEHPVFGVGPNNFSENYHAYTNHAFKTWVSRNLDRSTTHNYFLLMLTEQGYPAMILYAFLIYFSLSFGQKVYCQSVDKKIKYLSMTFTCMLAAFFVNNFLSDLIESDEVGPLLYLSIAALISLDLHNKKEINLFQD